MKSTVWQRTRKKNSLKSGKHSGKASHDQVLLQATVWEAAKCLSLFRICVNSYVYAVFLRLPCESIPTRQRFHLADKLITARVFNAHVGPARTKYARLHKSGDTHILFWWRNLCHAHCTLSLMYAYKMSTCTLLTQTCRTSDGSTGGWPRTWAGICKCWGRNY